MNSTNNGQSAAKSLSDNISYEEGSTTIPKGSTGSNTGKRWQFYITKIYTLTHPITKEIRYIGKTNYSLNDRLCKHMLTKEVNHRGKWIRSLKNKGLKPVIELLEECNIEDWKWLERYWISQFKIWGFILTNHTEGGESGTISDKCRKACIKSNTGRKDSRELIEKRSLNLKKKVNQFDKLNNLLFTYNSVAEAAKAIKGSSSHITECCNNKPKRKTHKGFIWKYKIKI